jgi:hypothetical protein
MVRSPIFFSLSSSDRVDDPQLVGSAFAKSKNWSGHSSLPPVFGGLAFLPLIFLLLSFFFFLLDLLFRSFLLELPLGLLALLDNELFFFFFNCLSLSLRWGSWSDDCTSSGDVTASLLVRSTPPPAAATPMLQATRRIVDASKEVEMHGLIAFSLFFCGLKPRFMRVNRTVFQIALLCRNFASGVVATEKRWPRARKTTRDYSHAKASSHPSR